MNIFKRQKGLLLIVCSWIVDCFNNLFLFISGSRYDKVEALIVTRFSGVSDISRAKHVILFKIVGDFFCKDADDCVSCGQQHIGYALETLDKVVLFFGILG